MWDLNFLLLLIFLLAVLSLFSHVKLNNARALCKVIYSEKQLKDIKILSNL